MDFPLSNICRKKNQYIRKRDIYKNALDGACIHDNAGDKTENQKELELSAVTPLTDHKFIS